MAVNRYEVLERLSKLLTADYVDSLRRQNRLASKRELCA